MTKYLFNSYAWLLQEFNVLIKQKESLYKTTLLSISAEEREFYRSVGMPKVWSTYFKGIPVFLKEDDSKDPHYIPREAIEYLAKTTSVSEARERYIRELEILQSMEKFFGKPNLSELRHP